MIPRWILEHSYIILKHQIIIDTDADTDIKNNTYLDAIIAITMKCVANGPRNKQLPYKNTILFVLLFLRYFVLFCFISYSPSTKATVH